MEWLNTIAEMVLALLTGVFLRLAVPLGLTALLVYWLRWLDARWQQEARPSRPVRVPTVRCWSIVGCPEERRANCPAYQNRNTPCWQLFRRADGQLKPQCLGCKVFREAPLPVAA